MRLLPLLIAALSAAPLAASETIKLRDGTKVTGIATAYDAQRQVLSFRLDGGQTKQYPLDQLDPRAVYLVHASLVPEDSGKGQLQLANLARDAGLYRHSARRYGYAESADPSLRPEVERERAKLRTLAADYCLANAKEAREKGNEAKAEEWLTLLLEKLPNEPQAAEAAALLEQRYVARRNEQQEGLDAEFMEKLKREAKKGKAAYDRMVEDTSKGLTARNASTAKRLWEGALKDGETVLEQVAALEKKYGEDPRVQAGAARYRQLTTEQMVALNLHLASQATAQSSLNSAMEYANAALALDPTNSSAAAARARIEQAANEGLINW